MKKLLLAAGCVLAIIAGSCKKAIQQQQQNIIVQAVTNGHWYVEQYLDSTTDVTAEFLGYEFQFNQNSTVDAILNTVTKSTGSWNTDINNYTITANFPVAAGDTLRRLNNTWKITTSYLDYVEAHSTSTGAVSTLHLRKK